MSDHFRLFGKNQQFIRIFRVLSISEGRTSRGILPLLSFGRHGAFHLFRNILTVKICKQRLESNINIRRFTNIVFTVIMVGNRDKTDTQKRKNLLQIRSHLNIVSGKPG